MNGHAYTSSGLQQQHAHQNSQQAHQPTSLAYLPAHAHIQQQQHHQLQRHLNNLSGDLASPSTTTYFDAHNLDKTFASTNRYLPALSSTPHSTILITNNFEQPTVTTPQPIGHNFTTNNSIDHNNMRMLSGTSSNSGNKSQTTDNVTLPQQLQQLLQQSAQNHHLTQFAAQHQNFVNFTTQQQQTPLSVHFGTTPAQYFMHHADAETNKLLHPLVVPTTTAHNSDISSTLRSPVLPTADGNNSTVVLDRINICINNHFNDAITNKNNNNGSTTKDFISNAPLAVLSCTTSKAIDSKINNELKIDAVAEEQQIQVSSPVIPAIKHNPLNMLCTDNSPIHIIDEPDSTTTPHTPPTTPDNDNHLMSSSPLEQQSPSTTSTTTNILNIENTSTITDITTPTTTVIVIDDDDNKDNEHKDLIDEDIVEVGEKPTKSNLLSPERDTVAFKIGEDVLLKRHDNRFYLGTVIDSAGQLFLVRFDDKSEQWCMSNEMRTLGGGGGDISGGSTTNDNQANSNNSNSMSNKLQGQTQMCLACKRHQPDDIVECCERCGRGYHRGCTTEVYPGSGEFLCKRCAKPMKVTPNCQDYGQEEDSQYKICRQLPYHVDTLNWDEKHRVNEEQIYCYCGKTGKFDYNMLQCCKCRNWYHIHCMQDFKSKILRGDSFFVFSCSVCNDGEEFLRRLQIDWIDVIHLTLYNLSAMKKHQHHKYHHLLKDIWPYVLEKRNTMPIPNEWKTLSENLFMDNIKTTLKEHTERFVCGREIKRDHYYYALRHNGPPITPKFHVHQDDILSDEFIIEKLNLKLLPDAPENLHVLPKLILNEKDNKLKEDIYEFRIEDDDKFTSEDDVPIKKIIDKVKRKKSICESTNDNNMNTCSIPHTSPSKTNVDHVSKSQIESPSVSRIDGIEVSKEVDTKITNTDEVEVEKEVTTLRNSRKRKAFTLSKSYKETASETTNKRFCITADSSSDENSSSSRGTSLDIIIPPPKNFLGPNNPFRMITPKKNINTNNNNVGCGSVKKSIFNTSGLNLSNKLAALKSAGIFQNMCTSNLAKAAGQPRTVRTIKRRLSAKDIMIGPNQEVRRRRIRRSSANIEVISTTTINPISTNLFPLYAKEPPSSVSIHKSQAQCVTSLSPPALSAGSSTSSLDSGEPIQRPTHGRLLRQRPQKQSPNNSRRGSMSSASSSSNQLLSNEVHQKSNDNNHKTSTNTASNNNKNNDDDDLKQSVNKYFGVVNRFESGEPYAIRAKRVLNCGLTQYLIEWGGD